MAAPPELSWLHNCQIRQMGLILSIHLFIFKLCFLLTLLGFFTQRALPLSRQTPPTINISLPVSPSGKIHRWDSIAQMTTRSRPLHGIGGVSGSAAAQTPFGSCASKQPIAPIHLDTGHSQEVFTPAAQAAAGSWTIFIRHFTIQIPPRPRGHGILLKAAHPHLRAACRLLQNSYGWTYPC